ncbi:serine/threonine protein phosphatase [Coralloluteibacterium stylophorae]|uniref:Serine/threonine protein phosphatase n=1 Tax=Coralloluteibacterium stylophorae TaxID=1776034 RepID=A0A8J7VTD9_9GAMM|nr:serine/threonine protein phosphatase [Coralloluteibacterium stylophorae]MBS7457632.1 serine/threonine protein phosphatase [Coralloluteibacterium stylophorae]
MAGPHPRVERAVIDGRPVWIKHYGSDARGARLRMLDWAARRLGVAALRPPPHHLADEALEVERARLGALAALGVRVPEVVGEGRGFLVLSDLGDTLSSRLRTGTHDGGAGLVARAAAAVADVHARGGYLGQPLARNLAVDAADRIGFLDFEEDPREVMSLRDAQVRDWLLFASGTVRYLPEGALAGGVAATLGEEDAAVRDGVRESVARLSFLGAATRRLGARARGLGGAVAALGLALAGAPGGMLAALLLVDLLHDGDIEALQLLFGLFS